MLSVLVPTYNRERYLIQCIESVLAQSFEDFEVIVIDDGSDIDNYQILTNKFHDNRIRYINNGRIKNIAKLFNIGIRNSRGNLIAITGDDDLWEHTKLEEQLKCLKDYKIVCSNAVLIDEQNKVLKKFYLDNSSDDFDIDLNKLLVGNNIVASSVVAYKDILNEFGGFDENDGNRAEDYSLWLKISEKHAIRFLNKPLVKYRIHPENLSTRSVKNKVELILKTISLKQSYLTSSNTETVNSAKIGIKNSYADLVKFYYSKKSFSKARFYCKNLLKDHYDKLSISYFKYLLFYFVITILSIFGKKGNIKILI